jgi:hypothetical protein
MSRKQGLMIVLAVAILLGFVLAYAAGQSVGDTVATENFVLAVIGKAIGLFIFPGILPCIVWAFMKFRRERLRPVMISWIVLQIAFAIASYWFDIRGVSAG